ncbi:MAG: serine/threonine-protein kinase [Verrucomicrobia bacterium]|nr:serine/threonine-protein kinase [Verrucomicrobiota bacterium]
MQLRQYQLHTLIGTGGMGTVYQAADLLLQRVVAIKLMNPQFAGNANAGDDFRREAQTCAALNHTNIISIYSFEQFAGQSWLVMELADRGSLLSRIEEEQRLPELEVLDIGVKIASALAAALKMNLLHRDIKPGNVLFNGEGEPKLVDFGLARAALSDAEQEPTLWATPYYVAPEKVKREPESFSSDLYSLAGTLYHALTGRPPFEGPTLEHVLQAHLFTPLTPPAEVVDGTTPPTCEALVRALAKSPAERYLSYDEFIMALTAARSQLLIEKFTRQTSLSTHHVNGKNAKRWWRFD